MPRNRVIPLPIERPEATIPNRHLCLVSHPANPDMPSFINNHGNWHEITHSGSWYDCDLETVLMYVRTQGFVPVYPGVL